MGTQEKAFFAGITRRRWTGLALVWVAILVLFAFLYANARRSILNEIRHQAMGVAIAIASAISPGDLAEVQGPEDMEKDAFRRVQDYLGAVQRNNADIRYVYTMRRSAKAGAKDSDYEYIVDSAARDLNGNGTIDEDEISEPPAKPYDAADLPELVGAWHRPGADPDVSPDPPYPDLISGYAPVKNELGQTAGIVGVDITASTVGRKLLTLRGAMVLVWLLLGLLITMVVQLYYQQQDTLERNRALSDELAARNDMLRAANAQLMRRNEQFQRDLDLAQSVQLGFLPKSFPRQDKVIFDKYYLTCEMLGGDLFDVFDIGEDHVAMYMADVAGHGVSAALISGLLKMAVASVRDPRGPATGHLQASLLRPDLVLETLNDMLIKEIPEYEFITMIYAVLDIPHYRLNVASAGHPAPLKFDPRTSETAEFDVPTGIALGLVHGSKYAAKDMAVVPGDKLVFFTDGLTEAMNEENEEFGDERVRELLGKKGQQSAHEIIQAFRVSVEEHRRGREVNDDFSLLVAEIR